MLSQLLIGLLAAGTIAGTAVYLRALTPGGALAATAVGAVVYGAGSLSWSILLLFFFLSGSFLSHALTHGVSSDLADKGSRRDARQVLANGGVQALTALASLAYPSDIWVWIFAGATAAAAADTWATEIGALSSHHPRSVASGRIVPPGTSGGVTLLGFLASFAASLCVAGLAASLTSPHAAIAAAVVISGLTGSFTDSILGATVQERRQCPVCRVMTEQRVHRRCGTTTVRIGGIDGLDNDDVNLLAILTASTVAVLCFFMAR